MSSTTIDTDLIQEAPLQRDAQGWWTHPGIPDLGEDHQRWYNWISGQLLEIKYTLLEEEPDDHPVRRAHFEADIDDISAWVAMPPPGAGWFVLSIHDTEDGPAWVWARRIGQGRGIDAQPES